MSKYEDQPAFPVPGLQHDETFNGMTLRQYAAIKLKVADSGVDWLDEMITKSKRDDIAAKAMQSYLCGNDRDHFTYTQWAAEAYQMADAMLTARDAA